MDDFACLKVVHHRLPGSNINVWNLTLFLLNGVFLLVLLWYVRPSLLRLREAKSVIMNMYYSFVWLLVLTSLVTCGVAMALADDLLFVQIMWLLLLFVHMYVELSVLVFLAHGSMRNSVDAIKITTVLTILLALTYAAVQAVLQFVYGWDMWARDGPAVLYWFARSFFVCLLYLGVLILPCTRWRHTLPLPAKTSFYHYVIFLLLLNCIQGCGCLIIYFALSFGYCLIEVTTIGYVGFFAPAVYGTFLWAFFHKQTGAIFYDVIYAAYEEASLQGYHPLGADDDDAPQLARDRGESVNVAIN